MTEEENLAEIYLTALREEKNSGLILTNFFDKLYEKPFSKDDIIMFNKLVRIYGKERVFSAILKMVGMDSADPENPRALLTFFCEKDLKEKMPKPADIIDVDAIKKKVKVIMKDQKPVRSPFDE